MDHLGSVRLLLAFIFMVGSCSSEVMKLNNTSWEHSLQGEWLVAFIAPWCPACRMFTPVWDEFSSIPALTVKVATVDVTESPVLSFVFLVSRLPTVFHIKDGVVRQMEGVPSISKLQQFLTPKVYSNVKPIPWYYSPASWHMRYFSRFMQVGMAITNVHQHLLDAGYPTWLSFVIIGCATIISGVVLGTVLVIVCDCFVPPRPQFLRFFRSSNRRDDASLDASKTQEITDDLLFTRSTDLSEAAPSEDEDEAETEPPGVTRDGEEEAETEPLGVTRDGEEEAETEPLGVTQDVDEAGPEPREQQHVEEEEDNGIVVVHRRAVAAVDQAVVAESKDQ